MIEALQTMTALKEAGAMGGILFDPAGRVLVHTMPSFFPTAALRSAGERIVVLFETMAENFEPVADLFVGFAGYVLLLRRSADTILAVVMGDSANREAVKMATNLVFRRLSGPQPAAPVRIPGPPPVPTRASLPREATLPAAKSTATPAKPAGPLPPAKPKKKSNIWGD